MRPRSGWRRDDASRIARAEGGGVLCDQGAGGGEMMHRGSRVRKEEEYYATKERVAER